MNENEAKAERVVRFMHALVVCRALGETIREVKQIPSGDLYAAVCGRFSLDTYLAALEKLKQADLVVEDGQHMLRWVEPQRVERN